MTSQTKHNCQVLGDHHILECKGNYSATSNDMELIHWPLVGGLLHVVQRGGDWAGPQSTQASPSCIKRPVYQSPLPNGALLGGFNVPVKGLIMPIHSQRLSAVIEKAGVAFNVSVCVCVSANQKVVLEIQSCTGCEYVASVCVLRALIFHSVHVLFVFLFPLPGSRSHRMSVNVRLLL